MRDNSYTRIRYVQETAEREERYTVNRPITETAEREEVYTVMKPVYETSCRTETYTVMRPQTVCQTQMVDQGGFVEQTVMKPAAPATRLRWMGSSCAVDPATGQTVYQRSGTLLGASSAHHCRSAARMAVEFRSAASSADIHGSASGIAPSAGANRALRARASGAQDSGDDLPHSAGGSGQESAVYSDAAGRGTHRAAGSSAGMPHGYRAASSQDSGYYLPHDLRRAGRAEAGPSVQDGCRARDGPRAALRGKADSRDVQLHRATSCMLSRADQSLR